jgi:hypothetical protein
MPTIVHCHTGRRLLALATGWAVALVTLAACSVADVEHTALATEARPAQRAAGSVDPDYFPSQFPAPGGDIEPLPPQF